MATILCFGDPITYGFGDTEGGWVGRIRSDLDRKKNLKPESLYYEIYNLGVSGDNSEGLLSRFEKELLPRIDEEEIIVTIGIGINDSQYLIQEKRQRISLDLFEKNLTKLILKIKKYTNKIIIIGPTSVDASKTNPIPWNLNKSYDNDRIKQYNEILKNHSLISNIEFVELLSLLDYKDLFDGLHPNSNGYQKMYKKIKGKIWRLIETT